MLHCLLPLWSSPSPTHLQHAHCILLQWAILRQTLFEFHFFLFQERHLWAAEPQLVGNTTLMRHFLVYSETEPSLCHSPHPAIRTDRAQHCLTPAPWHREVCNTSWCCMYVCQHRLHCHCHIQTCWKHHWLVLMQSTSLTLSSFSFPAPRGAYLLIFLLQPLEQSMKGCSVTSKHFDK